MGREVGIDIHMKKKNQKKKEKHQKTTLPSERNHGRNGITDLEGKRSFDIKGLKEYKI